MCTSAGVSPRQVDELTWEDLKDLFAYWGDNPPTHIMVQAFITGGKGTGKNSPRTSAPTDDEDPLAAFGAIGMPVFSGPPPGALIHDAG